MAVSFKGSKKYKKHNGFSDKSAIKSPFPSPVHMYSLCQGELVLKPSVKEGDTVLCGEKIADIAEFGAIPVLSASSGAVLSVTEDMITVENDMALSRISFDTPEKKPEDMTSREILWLLREAAVYEPLCREPLHVLLSEKRVADCIIVCCFDSDPYVSSPQAAARGNSKKILRALKISMRVSGIKRAYIAVENDTRKTYDDFKYDLRYLEDITLCCFKARYPQSRGDVLINSVTGSPLTNALILSPESLCDMANALERGVKVTRKLVTVSGDDILEANNFAVPLGSTISSLLESGGYSSPEIVISGGVIDGVRITDLDMPITADTRAILAFNSAKGIPKYRKKLL